MTLTEEFNKVNIGKQIWMAENLKINHFRNGDPIPLIRSENVWEKSGDNAKPAYCHYGNDPKISAVFGYLYNGIAVSDSRNIAPKGWHVPSDEDWKQLEIFLGMKPSKSEKTKFRGRNEGGKLKEFITSYWEKPNKGATNESGFSALPAGVRGYLGDFYNLGFNACFWSSTECKPQFLWMRNLDYKKSKIYRDRFLIHHGLSVRLIKD
ncbi:MAG: fibrobacter succinogenes major paralogous domain-containing protein [Bacteroidales bacterium]|nr:fibrobacter succinogenes major paralogous domain-containing protein [Bacteroidales bacterium]